MDKMPIIGLGTWRLQGAECERAVQQALELGYRHIDTADLYNNHQAIGKVLVNLPREDIFLATKLYIHDLTSDRVPKATIRFLDELGIDYIDLLYIHWPNPEVNLVDTLHAMVSLKEQGIIRYIGVSNFVPFHFDQLAPYHFPILTNQIELHPYFQRKALVAKCKSMGITTTAYRPVAKGQLENDSTLIKIGNKYGKSPSQVSLRWIIQQNINVIPKASNVQHLKDNMNIFDFHLTEDEIREINALDRSERLTHPPAPHILYEDDASTPL